MVIGEFLGSLEPLRYVNPLFLLNRYYLIDIIFQSSFRFTVKLNTKLNSAPMHVYSSASFTLPEWSIVEINEPTLTLQHQSPWCMLVFTFSFEQTMGFDKCIMTYICHYSIKQNSFTALKTPLCSAYSFFPPKPWKPLLFLLSP
jgi:hypothetical protein